MKDCNIVVLGADAVRKDGSIVNKVGSLAIALAAQRYNVPLMILAEKTKGEGGHRVVKFEASNPEEVSSSCNRPQQTPYTYTTVQ